MSTFITPDLIQKSTKDIWVNLSQKLQTAFANCKCLVFDFDGVFTNNKVYLTEDGKEMIICDRSDTFGLSQLQKQGLHVLILTMEKAPMAKLRGSKIGVEVIQGLDDKGPTLKQQMLQRGVTEDETIYVGNDVNDLVCFDIVGMSIAVADAYPAVKERAQYVTSAPGGNGAVREVLELLLLAKAS